MKIYSLVLLTLFSINTFGSCTDAYQKASKKRDIRNEIIAVTTGVGAMAIAPTLFPTATIYFVGKYTLTVVGVVSVTELKRSGLKIYKNNFDKMLLAFEAAEKNEDNFLLNRLISRSIKRSDLEKNTENEERAKEIIVKAFSDESFCPIIGEDRHGREKRHVFNRSAVIDFVAINLKKTKG